MGNNSIKLIPAIETDYSGWFKSRFVGGSATLFGIPGTDIGVGFSAGKAWFEGMPDFTIGGSSWYFGVGAGIGLPWPVEAGVTATKYRPRNDNKQYWLLDSRGRKYATNQIHRHFLQGQKTPWVWPPYTAGFRPDMWLRTKMTNVDSEALYQVYLYNQINRDSYGPGDKVPEEPPQ